MGGEIDTPDRRVAAVAARQENVVARAQVLRCGLTSRQIDRRVAAGRWRIEHRGVYVVGPAPLSTRGRWIAALLAVDGSALSHRTALAAWDLVRTGGPVHVTVATAAGRTRRGGVIVHRSRTMSPADVVRVDGLPVTSARRTLADARRSLSPQRFAAIVRRAEIRRLDVGPIPGFGQRIVEEEAIRARMDAIIRARRLPDPRREVVVDAYTVDYLWPQERLVVETDGRRTHDVTSAFEADRLRDARLAVLGYRTLRFTWARIADAPGEVGATLAVVLGVAR